VNQIGNDLKKIGYGNVKVFHENSSYIYHGIIDLYHYVCSVFLSLVTSTASTAILSQKEKINTIDPVK
jgi:hypothetical protein